MISIDGDYIVAIDGLGRHTARRLCPRQGAGTGRHAVGTGEGGNAVVLADEQYGQAVERGPVEPFEKGAAVDRAVAEHTGDDGVGLLQLETLCCTARNRDLPATTPFAPSMPTEKSAMCIDPPLPPQ